LLLIKYISTDNSMVVLAVFGHPTLGV